MFRSARVQLTAWYLLIIMIVSSTFSFIIFRVLSNEVKQFEQAQRYRMERRIQESGFLLPNGALFQTPVRLQVNEELITETEHHIITILLVLNGVILFLSGGLAYFLAAKTLEPIQLMVAEQHRFISDASHELKTPLTSLKTAFEVYLRSREKTLDEALEIITESVGEVNRLQSLSESLLKLAQGGSAQESQHSKKFLLNDAIDLALKRVKPLAKEKDITVSVHSTVGSMVGVSENISDLLVILLDNAIKYSKSKTSISILATKHRRNVELRVEDHGRGISQSNLPYIFDRFFRVDASRKQEESGGGYGLGLSIAKKIVDAMHGSIQVTSTLGEGTTFTITIPQPSTV